MRKDYGGKLIRDNIPEILDARGVLYSVRTVSPEAYRAALVQKLFEEAEEVRLALPDKVKEELADVVSVIAALAKDYGFAFQDVLTASEEKDSERGGFVKRLALDWTDDRE